MPLSGSTTILEFQELHHVTTAFPALGFPTTRNYAQHAPPFLGLGGLNVNTPYIWKRTVTITAVFDSKYQFHGALAQCGFDPNGNATVTEVYERQDKVASVTYVTVVPIYQAVGHAIANALTNDSFLFTASVNSPSPNGLSGSETLSQVEIFGEPVAFGSHSASTGGHEVFSGGQTLRAVLSASIGAEASITAQIDPKTVFNVKFKPIDLEGNFVTKPVLLLFGSLYSTGPYTIATDFGEFIQEKTTPFEEEIVIAQRCPQIAARVRTSTTTLHSYNFDAPVKSRATNVQIFWRYAAFGDTPLSFPYLEIVTPKTRNINHLFTDDADCRGIEFATLHLASPRTFSLGAWTATGDGASAVGSTLTAGDNLGTFRSNLSPIKNASPFRYLAFDYAVSDGEPNVVIDAICANLGFEAGYKAYNCGNLSGSGTKYIDTLAPSSISGISAGTFPRLEVHNQAQTSPTAATNSRLDGLISVFGFRLKFREGTIAVSNFRMVERFESAISHRKGTADGSASETAHVMAGHVDGRDAFRLATGSALSDLVGSLQSFQNLTLDSTNYALPAHSPATTMASRPQTDLDVQTPDFGLQVNQSATAGFTLKASLGSVSGIEFFYGRYKLNWDGDDARAVHVWGNEASATPVGGRTTTVRVMSPANPSFTVEYDAASPDLGLKVLPESRYQRGVSVPLDVQHFVPRHASPQTKQLINLNAIGHRYHIFVGGTTIGKSKLSYDVSSSLRHYRAQVRDDGFVWIGVSDNTIDWNDFITEIEAEAVCLRVGKRNKEQWLYLWVQTPEGNLVRHQSDNEGSTWQMPTTISSSGTVKAIAGVIGANNQQFVYWLDGDSIIDVKGKIFDAADNVIEDEFTAIADVDEGGIAAQESVKQGGIHRIIAQVVQSGNLMSYEGPQGRNFS